MMTGFRGTFVISWSQTELDGLTAAPLAALSVGATWAWTGEATRVDGPADVLVLGPSEETADLRRHAARAVRRLVHAALDAGLVERLGPPDDPVLEKGFALTDGLSRYTATLIEVPDRARPLLMFLGDLPPAGRDLWVTHVSEATHQPNRSGDLSPEVICFTPATRIATPEGTRAVADLAEGDLVLTRDDGPRPIRWIGARRMSGARLYAMPELRPVRIRAGALGDDRPEGDLLVSPRHRILVRGPAARDLFGTDEVLVAACDLIDGRSILVDHRLCEVTYVHLLLDRHQILWANGVETESFHPGATTLEAVAPAQRAGLLDCVPGLEADAAVYGAPARRVLSRAEAAVMQHRAA